MPAAQACAVGNLVFLPVPMVVSLSEVLAAVALSATMLLAGALFLLDRRRRAVDQSARDSERRFQTNADNMPVVVYQQTLSPAGEFAFPYVSARIRDFLGVAPADAMADASRLFSALHADDIGPVRDSLLESAHNLSPWSHRFRASLPDGGCRWLYAAAVPSRRDNGEVLWNGIIADESDRQAMENALSAANGLLTEANRRLSAMYETAHQFVDDVAHEFRTPLAVIKEYAAIMQDGLVGEVNAEQQDYLRVIDARADDLNGLVNDMLDLSRLEAGIISVARRRCDVDEVLTQVRPLLARRASVSGVEFSVDIEAGLPPIYCDPRKIGRVIINLAINAFKYGGDKGGVRLWARRKGRSAEVEIGISDRGPGIPPEKLDMIFERFQQAGGLRDTAKGFGLGLSIVRELVNLNLGEVSVASVSGEGSTFSFSVPEFDPAAIVARFIAHVSRQRSGLFFMADVGISVSGPGSASVADACDSQLLQQAHADELLLRLDAGAWVLLTTDKLDKEVRERTRALQERLVAYAAEIADGGVTIDVQPRGIWRLPSQQDALVARMKTLRDINLSRRSA